jgi:hypothetical protein
MNAPDRGFGTFGACTRIRALKNVPEQDFPPARHPEPVRADRQ